MRTRFGVRELSWMMIRLRGYEDVETSCEETEGMVCREWIEDRVTGDGHGRGYDGVESVSVPSSSDGACW